MTSGHTVTITPSDAHVEVRLDGELLAKTDKALRLDETGLPPRYYIPKGDVRMDLDTLRSLGLNPDDYEEVKIVK